MNRQIKLIDHKCNKIDSLGWLQSSCSSHVTRKFGLLILLSSINITGHAQSTPPATPLEVYSRWTLMREIQEEGMALIGTDLTPAVLKNQASIDKFKAFIERSTLLGNVLADNIAFPSSIKSRKIFYNRSTSAVFGNGSGNPITSIDTNKNALLPGQTPSFANYTNYSRGLNGIIIDIKDTRGNPTAADFRFATWNGIDASGFAPLAIVPTVTVIPGVGIDGSNRVKIDFPDLSVKDTWLQVKMLASATTSLPEDDVFYFGNAIGDTNTGNVGAPLVTVRVNATDTSSIRQNQLTSMNSAIVTNIYDLNKDGRVNATDTSLVRQNQDAGVIKYFVAPTN